MSVAPAPGGIKCPSCRAPMASQRFARKPMGEVDLDFCFDCKAIWFDQYESSQLTPGAVIELFKLIHEHRDAPGRALADAMRCPHCVTKLVFTQDVQRTNRITYYRCPKEHGRATTFVQFLREKNFIRDLSKVEIEGLAATVKQVKCSSCGAPIDLQRDTACSHCRAAISVLDEQAVAKALADLQAGELQRAAKPDMGKVADALLAKHRMPQPKREPSPWLTGGILTTPIDDDASPVLDLVAMCIDALFSKGD